jgi:anti-sigma B factor antagonist
LNFTATIRHSNKASLVSIEGRLTFLEAGVLHDNISRLLREGHKNIVFNLRGLQYLDSSGVGELARTYATVVKHGGEMKVIGLTSRVDDIFKVTKLYQVFPEFPDEQSALQSFPTD